MNHVNQDSIRVSSWLNTGIQNLPLVYGMAILPEDSTSHQRLSAGIPYTAGAPAALGPDCVFLSTHSKHLSQQPSELSETIRENQVAGGHTGFLETLETCLSEEALQCHPAQP